MQFLNSFKLFEFLYSLELLEDSPLWWWPNAGSFEVVVGAILTQNTKWENVEKSLQNLYQAQILSKDDNQSLQNLAQIDSVLFSKLIISSGFANQKSIRLKKLCQNILQDFGEFDNFVEYVTSEWLIMQKGIGFETRDAILNYACLKEVMVVDKYSYKLLLKYGYEIEDYHELQEWFTSGVIANFDKILELYAKEISLAQVYARFHGKIVEFAKRGFKA